MLSFLMRRLVLSLAVLCAISVITFVLSHVAIDPAVGIAGDSATPADIALIRAQFGFDRPLAVQYLAYLGQIMQGDLGVSYLTRQPVADMILSRAPVTATLAGLAILLALALAVPLGVLAALRPGSGIDRLALTIAVTGQAIPNFWAGLLLILLFGVTLGWLPISGSASWAHFVLPTLTLGTFATPALMRLVRAGMIEVLEADYIRTARAMGLHERTILFRFALRPAILPVISLTAVQLGFMLGGSVVVESVFALQGIGYLAWQSMTRADMPVIQAIVLMVALIYVGLMLLADALNALLDPRIRAAQ